MTVESTQAEAFALLAATYDRARSVVAPDLFAASERRIRATLTHQEFEEASDDPAHRAAFTIIDQMLMDVSRLDDATVAAADEHFDEGGLANFVMAAYVIEARTRLVIASERLWPQGRQQ